MLHFHERFTSPSHPPEGRALTDFITQRRGSVANIDLTAGNVVLATIQRRGLGQACHGMLGCSIGNGSAGVGLLKLSRCLLCAHPGGPVPSSS